MSYLRPKEVEAEFGIRAGQLAQMRYMQEGPKYIKPGARTVLYRRSDIEEWLERSTVIPAAA